MKFFLTLLLATTFMAQTVSAATLGIIDSGTDMLHTDIAPFAWINPAEIEANDRDEDENGYIDDIHGWNFAEGDNKVIDYKYLGTLTFDVKKFFDLQSKSLLGTITQDETEWLKIKREDQEFLQKLMVYGNFMHGTHVTGISLRDVKDDVKILAAKIIPTEVKLPFYLIPGKDQKQEGLGLVLLKMGLEKLAKENMKLLTEVAGYIHGHKVDVANGSFGTNMKVANMIVENLFKLVMRRDPEPYETKELALHFMNTLLKEGNHVVTSAPDTLFVFAAGNDGTNNDEVPTSPTNIDAPNVISVAATLAGHEIAVFSNYGERTVDVAAPGVAIESAVPGNKHLKVSGTSQAAPYVANIAIRLKSINPDLSPRQIKKVIMGTVDERAWLEGKVKTGGIVNASRAVRAAELSLTMSTSAAVSQSHIDVVDLGTPKSFYKSVSGAEQFVLPLPNGFVIK